METAREGKRKGQKSLIKPGTDGSITAFLFGEQIALRTCSQIRTVHLGGPQHGMDSPYLSGSRNGNADGYRIGAVYFCHERHVHSAGVASPSDRQTECGHPDVRVPIWELNQTVFFSPHANALLFPFPCLHSAQRAPILS